ncbi:MAG TPA: SCO family protein [Tianweitania sediminis]|jgi:protein SCO1/2|nr:SCO family protein [Tianweitania sediminis]
MRWLALLLSLFAAAPALALFDPFAATGIDNRAGAPVPLDGTFLQASGTPITLRELSEGKPLVLVPVVHDCPNICGTTLRGVADSIEQIRFVPGRDFTLVAFGIDPREQPAAAQRNLDELGRSARQLVETGGIHALTGAEGTIRAVTDAMGFRYAFNPDADQYAHLAATAVLTPDGRLSRWLYGLAPDPTDLRLALTEAGDGQVGSFADQLLLLCYHYDPVTGRYGSTIWTILRTGGVVSAALLFGFIGVALRREHKTVRSDAP